MSYLTHQYNCPECGADPFKTVDYDRIVKEQQELENRFKKVLAHHGLRDAEWTIERIKLEESMRYLQRKTKKQAATLSRLEEKLRGLGKRPYEEEKRSAREITGM